MRLQQQLAQLVRTKGYAINTEKAYVMRYRQFVQFTKEKYGKYIHPKELTAKDVEAFLSHLSNQKDVASSTQRSALSAIRFLYEEVLGQELGELKFAVARDRKKCPLYFPVAKHSNCLSVFRESLRKRVRLPANG